MEIQWIKHRRLVAAYYRSANAYTALCRRENLSSAGMNPVEVQIIEQIIEHADENNNMKWYAGQLGISTSAFTNYVNRLTQKGLVEKFHTSSNRKNIILRVSEAGLAAYEEYASVMQGVFSPIFDIIDAMSDKDQQLVIDMLNKWADQQLIGTDDDTQLFLVPAKSSRKR